MLRVRQLSLNKKQKSILKELTFDFPSKQITVLLGKSGCGKTSLLRCLAQLEKQYVGDVTYKEKELNSFSPKERCQLIGYVSQSYGLFPHMNVFKNCAQPLSLFSSLTPEEIREKVIQILSTLGIEELKDAYPSELSGGQQQRVAIARALVLEPIFLLLDEPTSALDPENTEILTQIILKLKKEGKGVIIASQDMPFAEKVFERVLFLEEGELNGRALENYFSSNVSSEKL